MTTDIGIEARFQLEFPGDDGRFSLDIDVKLPGEGITAVFGPSGSGKTSLLRCMAGLQQAPGRMQVNGDIWQDECICLPTHKRNLGYVFQESSLFPHLTGAGNLAYAVRRATRLVSAAEYDHAVRLMGLESCLERYPANLSGGERQRIAIARALMVQPQLLLMDEPLASLDMARKQEILPYLERLHEELALPVIYVSHNLEEVSRLADYLVIIEQGRLVKAGSLGDVLSSIDVPLPLGEESGVVVEGTIAERDEAWHLLKVRFSGGVLWVRDGGEQPGSATRIRILARDISLVKKIPDHSSIQNFVPVEVCQVEEDVDAAMALVRLRAEDDYMVARLTRRSVDLLGLQPGSRMIAQIKAAAIVR